jgi:DNA-binding transcriptional LysR family regulator
MDLRRLRYFVAVAEEGSVGRAARRLGMSQPPLSRRIRELEDELGCALFARTPRKMVLTKAGEVLLTEARTLLGHADRVRERVGAAAGASLVRVGVIGPAEEALSARVAHAFARSNPEADVRLVQGDFGDPTIGLTADRVDVAITFTPFRGAGIATEVIREQGCSAAVPASGPLAAAESLRRGDLEGHLAIQFPDGTDPEWRAHWQPGHREDGPVVRCIDECLHAVLWQRAVAIVPAQVRDRHEVEGIAYVPLTDCAPSRLVLAWRRADRSPLVAAYREAFLAAVPSRPLVPTTR